MEKHNIHITFEPGAKTAEIKEDVWQHDFGQTLQIEGLSLPPTIEVHYANKGRDTAIPQVGVTKDGITTAPIPNEILSEKGAFTAYIFVTDGKSGETCYTITGYINKRPALKEFDTPEDQEILHAAVGAVNAAAERAESAETKATAAANQTAKDAKQTAADREAVKIMVESVSGIGEQVTKVENLTKQAQTSPPTQPYPNRRPRLRRPTPRPLRQERKRQKAMQNWQNVTSRHLNRQSRKQSSLLLRWGRRF